MDITVCRIGDRAFLKLDGASVEIKDYKISSPMHGRTELEVVFEFDGGTTEFSSAAGTLVGSVSDRIASLSERNKPCF